MLHLRALLLSIFAGSAAVLALVLGALVLTSCASMFTTPQQDCEKLCRGQVEAFTTTYEGPQCKCKDVLPGVKL